MCTPVDNCLMGGSRKILGASHIWKDHSGYKSCSINVLLAKNISDFPNTE